MDWEKELFDINEKPLDRMADGYSNTSAFRKIAFIGDSLSSGEFETRVAGEKVGYYDMFEYSWGQYIARKNGLFAYNFSRGGLTAKEYVESYGETQGFWDAEKKCQAYVIDLFKYGPAHDKKLCEKFYLHGHLSPMGYILTARIIDSYIDYIIRHNPQDFKDIGFIGTDIKYK